MDVYLHTLSAKVPAFAAKKGHMLDLPGKLPTMMEADKGSTSLRMNELKKMLAATPEVDDDRVARVTNAIIGRQYEVNPQKAAEKIIEFELLLP
jgi:hypothetical protein